MKYNKLMRERICELISSGNYSDKDVCKIVGIDQDTLINWKNRFSDFSDAIQRAYIERQSSYAKIARSGMAKRLDFYEYEEITDIFKAVKEKVIAVNSKGEVVETTKDVAKKVFEKRVKKVLAPSDNLIRFVLTNAEPEYFREASHVQADITSGGEVIELTLDLGKKLPTA